MDLKARSHIKKIMQTYDALAPSYDKIYTEEQKAKFKLGLLNTQSKKPLLILDCGCGTGLLLSDLPKQAFIVGLDISIKMLLGAKNKKNNKIHLIRGDAEFPPFKSSTFNTIYAFTIIDKLRVKKLFTMIRDLLTDNGCVILSIPKQIFSTKILNALRSTGLNIIDFLDQHDVKDYIIKCLK